MIKKTLNISIVFIIITLIFLGCSKNIIITNNLKVEKSAKIGVLLYKLSDEYISLVKKDLDEIQKENKGTVEFVFLDANGDQKKQNEQIDKLLQENIDLLLVNLVDTSEESTQIVINKIKEKNIPVIMFNREPISKIPIKSYENAIVLAREPEAGILQGEIVSNLWKNERFKIDKNRDNIMQYVILVGEPTSIDAISRTKYSIETIKNNGIKIEELARRPANWDRNLAKQAMTSLLYQYGNKIEVVIANNDEMAIGAIEALQEQNYNKYDKNKTITVVGVDAIPEAQELIKKGFMAGTVFQDAKEEAVVLYNLGMNLISGKNAIENTEYKFDDSGVTIRLPYQPYTYNSQNNINKK
ncbi:galactose ABC transporter substrate-binding protein [Clostridium taeniosporum]|uniref:D-galactose/methyl-galactoside binding periplasmic protein MglB n=1 Tax=Clostridium taeniosporum TaxID=394958 RepID=A0A1D7XL74_9CLOT|nr:galactose ABC transporter substrate-binding protein [Clostridium taeniosporum]AOR24037.1 galactose ABC transporter substrate-binding protein [Clostridium taeniosporum]